jgi:RHS repeat-associated protein
MHARYFSAHLGRFMSVDRFNVAALQFGDAEDMRRFREHLVMPQSWNRYSYARDNPMLYIDPNGEEAMTAVGTLTWTTLEGGAGAGAGGLGLSAGVATGGAILAAGGVGYGLGTLARKIPGVDEFIQGVSGKVIDFVFTAQNNRQTAKVVTGLIAGAQTNLNNIASAGGPDKDPDFEHHQKEIKAILDRAAKVAKRLPGKLRDKLLGKIEKIAEEAGVRLAE